MERHRTPSAAALLRSGVLTIAAAVASAALGAQQRPGRNVSGAPLPPAQACYDVAHYDLRIAVDPTDRTIDGDLTMRATLVAASPAVWLDLDDDLTVSAVELDGAAVRYERTPGRIEIAPEHALAVGKPFAVRVRYGGHPRVAVQPPWRGGFTWAKTPDGQPWIATSCQGEGADLWWPCKDQPSDKPATFDLWCTVPKGLTVASNGTLVGEPTVDGERATFHWHSASPISNYCVALNIAPYVELKDTFTCIDGTRMPVSFFVLPQSVAKAKRCMPQFLDHLHVFERLLGPYPFRAEKYGIAETPHLGMEHQTIIAYGNHFDDEQYDWLHNHELSHEWWGNLVTCRDWKDMWLHEGFGTYMQPLYREIRFGKQEYIAEMLRDLQAMNRTPVAPRETRDSQQIYFGASGNDIYYKGAWVLHTLRWQLGDELFFQALRRFAYPTEALARATDGSQVRLVDTDDFVALCSELAGEDLGWFFDVYVHSAGLPELHYAVEGGVLRLRWQTPGDLPFSLAVPVTLHGEVVRVAMPGGRGELKVADFEFLVDREHQVLMRKPVRD